MILTAGRSVFEQNPGGVVFQRHQAKLSCKEATKLQETSVWGTHRRPHKQTPKEKLH